MPKINRIRIANIQYDKKVIKDLFLNCYNGENVLLNLANGGGKSVLVQLLQQPLLPESKIHGREVHSYLSSDHASYILIEWKLDNSSRNYLLTGIVMSRLLSSDDMNKTKYFTFLNEYQSSNEFDIKNIPFIQKEENAYIYKSYEAAMQMIRDNRTLENLRSFARGEQAEYRSKLAEYGIFINEWKTLSKINENEGGVDELFKDCKTSDSLVDKWILKAISDSNEAESRELKEMFVSLMQEIIDKEKNIKEKEILEEFKEKIEEYQGPLIKLLEQLDKEKQIEAEIYKIYLSLLGLKRENESKIDEIGQKIIENEKELEQIKYEEASEEYYHLQNDFEAIKEEKEEKQEQYEAQKQILDKAVFEYRIQKVAHLYQKEKQANAKIDALKIKKSNIENKSNLDEELVKIEYNLQEKYSKKIVELKQEIEKIETENRKIKEECEENRKKKEKKQNNINEISNKIGLIQGRIDSFEQEEKALFSKINIFITRNLLNELEEREVQSVKDKFENQIQQINDKIQQNKVQIGAVAHQIEELDNKEEEDYKQLQDLRDKNVQEELKYKEFQKQEEAVKQILNLYRINEKNIFQKDVYMGSILEKSLEYKRGVEELVSKIDRTKEYLVDLEQGGIHNSREVRKALENANIGYITGEEYLKEQKEEYRLELLEKNPLLPYCYIVTQNDLEKIKNLEIKEEANKLAPILTYSSISKEVDKENQIIQMGEVYFLSLYNKECFCTDTKQYKKKLEEQLESYKKRKLEKENKLHEIEDHLRILDNFNYQEKDKKEMCQNLEILQKQIEDKNKEIVINKEQKNKLEKENETRRQENGERQEDLRNQRQEQLEFLEYLNKNNQYCKDKKQKEIYEEKFKEETQEIENAEKKDEEYKEKMQQNVFIKKDSQNRLSEIEAKNAKIPKVQEKQEELGLSLEELEAQYEQLTKKYEQDIKQIDEQIDELNEKKEDAQRERQKEYSDIEEENYISLNYSEEMEDVNKEKKEEEERKLKQKEEELNKRSTEYTRVETKLNTSIETLKKMGKQEALPASQIKGSYDERKSKISKEKEEGRIRQKEYADQNTKMQKQINDIERSVDIKVIASNNALEASNQNKIDTDNLKELIIQYNELKNENQTCKNSIYKKHVDIKSNYQDKHRIIKAFLESVTINEYEQDDYGAYYYIYEKLVECLKMLKEYIGVLNLSLQNIELDKKNILQHAVKQGIMLYQEMKKISESAKVRIGERYVQILKIEIPQELKEYADKRIETYLEEHIQSLREECKQSEDVRRTIESKVAIYLSDRKLLNLVLDVETIKVRLYKFDIENKNSGLRQWEEVIVGNSGGQKFIACFALFSALVEYTRRKELESLGEDDKVESSKVFILDNPFGKTSSKHLLEPMIEISKKFNIQMICLSDLSQSSITDKFALIYQLALRNTKYTNNSFLMIEETRNNSEAALDASLEQVYLRSQTGQISFWN